MNAVFPDTSAMSETLAVDPNFEPEEFPWSADEVANHAFTSDNDFERAIDRLRSRGILGRGATLLLVYAGFFGLVVVVALLIIPSAVNQFAELGTRITPLLLSAREWAQTVEPRALSVSLTGLIDTLQRVLVPTGSGAPEPDQLIALGLTFAEIVISTIAVLTRQR